MDISQLLAFIGTRLGRTVHSPGGIGGQSVHLCVLWMLATTGHRTWSNAAEMLTVADPKVWDVVHNTPDNAPPPGAIVVWGAFSPLGIGTAGHCAIAVESDTKWMVTLDQNWPPGSPVTLVAHTYGGVLGWLLPKIKR